MTRQVTAEDYGRRIARVIDFIFDHLDDELTTEKLAEIACFSPHHWHRIYRSVTGETAADAVRRLRLLRAANDLAKTDAGIERIAARAGYGSVAAFSRAFRADYGVPPATYRTSGLFPEAPKPKRYQGAKLMYDVAIKDAEARRLVAVSHRGPYLGIGRAFEKLGATAGPRGLINGSSQMVGVYHDDPSEVPEAELRSDAGFTIGPDARIDGDDLHEVRIAGGRSAVLRHRGPYSELETAYRWLFGEWLPNSGEEAGDAPAYEVYVNDPRSTKPADLLTDIHLPLK